MKNCLIFKISAITLVVTSFLLTFGIQKVNAQTSCVVNGITITASGSTTAPFYFSPSDAINGGCPVAPFTGVGQYTGATTGGTLTYTFSSPVSSATVSYTAINGPPSADVGEITVNNFGIVTLSNPCGVSSSGTTLTGTLNVGMPAYGDAWVTVSSTIPFTTLTLTCLNNFSGWVQGNLCDFSFIEAPSSLPTELLDFRVINSTNDVRVEWKTRSERNSESFIIQRSDNGSEWIDIQKTDGAGNSTSLLEYATTDFAPLSGVSYYRLKQIDFDGEFMLSTIASVNRISENDMKISIYPNPASSSISINGRVIDEQSLEVYNTFFDNVTSLTHLKVLNKSSIILDVSKLSNGIYYLKSKNVFEKIVKL